MLRDDDHLLWRRARLKEGVHATAASLNSSSSSSSKGKSMTATGLSYSLSSASGPELDPSLDTTLFIATTCIIARQTTLATA